MGLGIKVYDTAPSYGQSEAILGALLHKLPREVRDGLTIMTKAGETWDAKRQVSQVDHSTAGLLDSVDRSLATLGRIDVLQIHKATAAVVESEAVQVAIAYARAHGVQSIGASVSDVATAEAVIRSGIFDSIQFPLNRIDRRFEVILPDLRALRMTAIVNRPLAMGALLDEAGAADPVAQSFAFVLRQLKVGVILAGTSQEVHLRANHAAYVQAAALVDAS